MALESTEALTDSCQDNGGTAADSGRFPPLCGCPEEEPGLLPSVFLLHHPDFSSLEFTWFLSFCRKRWGGCGRESESNANQSFGPLNTGDKVCPKERRVEGLRADTFPRLMPKCFPECSMCFPQRKELVRYVVGTWEGSNGITWTPPGVPSLSLPMSSGKVKPPHLAATSRVPTWGPMVICYTSRSLWGPNHFDRSQDA